MYINFQQNRVKTQVMTVLTSLFAKKIASCINLQLPIIIVLSRLFQTCIIVKRTCISIFSKIGLVDQSNLCTQMYLQTFFPLFFSHSDLYCIFLLSLCNMLYNDACLKELVFLIYYW